MLVTEVIEKQAIGKDPEKMKIKLIGTDVKTGKVIKNAFRLSTTSIEVISGADDVKSTNTQKKVTKKSSDEKNESKSIDDFSHESSNAGAALTAPVKAGAISKGSYVLLKGNPCKVVEVSTSKTGKHGHAKAKITGTDIFTGKKYIDICPTSHNMDEPVVTRVEWSVIDVSHPDRGGDGRMSLMGEDGSLNNSLDLPLDSSSGELNEVGKGLLEAYSSGKDIKCIVLSSMNKDQIVDWRVNKEE